MSNLWFNVSLGAWHLQLGPDFRFWVRVLRNHHIERPWHRLTVHCAFGRHF